MSNATGIARGRTKLPASVRLAVKVRPNARQTGFLPDTGPDGEVLVSLKAPAVDGKANKALIDFLADAFRTKKRHVCIVAGERSRLKTVEIQLPGRLPTGLGWRESPKLGRTSECTDRGNYSSLVKAAKRSD